MDPLVKRLLVIGVVGLIVTWGTFLALEFTPQDEDQEPNAVKPEDEHGAGVSFNKTREQNPRIATLKRKRPVKKPSPVRPPVVNRPVPSPVPQQTAAIKAPTVPDLSPKTPPKPNPGNTVQARFNDTEKLYESEIRDSDWADEKEKRILDLFKKGDYEEALVDISCRKTLCRLEVRMDSPETFYRVFKLPGLASEIGLNAVSQPVGDGEQRRMVSFIARKGEVK